MSSLSALADDLSRINSTFNLELLSNLDDLIQHLEEMVAVVKCRDGEAEDKGTSNAMWDGATQKFNGVLSGLQSFLTGLFVEQSKLERETDEVNKEHEVLEREREELLERSHELHCRIQYNALESKLDQSFRSTERCSSVDSAKCFRDEAEENLRQTNEMIRVGNLRKCQLDRDIFNQMEHVTNQFKKYESEREDYVKEIELFDDVRRKKISNWLNDPRSDEERELGESIIEFLDLSSRRRHLEPKIIGNILHMHFFNESLAFDRQDYLKRLEEMTYLQQKVDSMCGVDRILPRKTPASTDLSGEGNQSAWVASEDDAYSDYLEGHSHQAPSGVTLHKCPKKLNLATDPITEPHLIQQLEAALRWENADGTSFPTTNLDHPTEGASTTVSIDFHNEDLTSTPKQISSADSELDDEAEDQDENAVHENDAMPKIVQETNVKAEENGTINKIKEVDHFKCIEVDSVTSVCGDALVSQTSKCSQTEGEVGGFITTRGATFPGKPTPLPLPKSSHLLLHHIESSTGVRGSGTAHEELMACLVKRKSSGGHSSMTAIETDRPDTMITGSGIVGPNPPVNSANTPRGGERASTDDRDTRSQGTGSTGRPGLSSATNTGNSRTSRDHL